MSKLGTKISTEELDFLILELIKKRTAAENPIGVAEIHRELNGIVSKKSMFYRVKKMEESNQIINTTVKPKDPKYIINKDSDFDIKTQALFFKIHQGMFSLVTGMTLEERKEFLTKSPKGKIITELIFQFGMNQLYTILESYNQKNRKNQELWLRNASAYENTTKASKPSELVKRKIVGRYIKNKSQSLKKIAFDFDEVSSDYDISKMEYQDEQIIANQLLTELSAIFPESMMERQDNARFEEDTQLVKLIKNVKENNLQFLID